MAISPSLEYEHKKKNKKKKKNGVDHLTIPCGRLIRPEVAISLFLNSGRGGWPSPHPLTEKKKKKKNGGGHIPITLRRVVGREVAILLPFLS
jgi:hypothetical protein